MCTSYESNPALRFEAFSMFPKPNFDYKPQIYKDYSAPIFRRGDEGWVTESATFGMVPRKRIPPGVKVFDTMNARSETVGQKRSYSGAWKNLQLCLIPCETFYEPNYESGKPVRWRIGLASGEPLAIAGVWRAWDDLDGSVSHSFSMLTVNANDHPLMNRFHRPGDEKRSLVIIPATEYKDWLSCRNTDEARSFFQLYPVDGMRAEPFPLPPRKAATKSDDFKQQSLLDDDGG